MQPGAGFHTTITDSPYVYVIGVAGDSGSGKSTFTAAIRHFIGDDLVTTITLDDYHLYGREERKKLKITPLSPDANDIGRLERDVATLRSGRAILKNIYNHETGVLEGPEQVPPSRVIILEGLHPLFTPRLRSMLDFSLYVDPAADVKREWKIKRDMEKRGYTENEVRMEMAGRLEDYRRFIAPQRGHADGVIGIGFSRFGRELGWKRNVYRITISLVPLFPVPDTPSLSLELGSLLSVPGHPCSMEMKASHEKENVMGMLTLDGEFPYRSVETLVRNLNETTGIDPARFLSGGTTVTPTEIVQILLCWRIITHRLSLEGSMRAG